MQQTAGTKKEWSVVKDQGITHPVAKAPPLSRVDFNRTPRALPSGAKGVENTEKTFE